jgi:hypothetical protein
MVPVVSYCTTLETVLYKNDSIRFIILLDRPVGTEQQQKLTEICDTINRLYGNYLQANPLVNANNYPNDGIKITIFDSKFLDNSLNFLDLNKSRSFFNEKYYIKLVLNKEILKSPFFLKLENENSVLLDWITFFNSDSQINLKIKCPGRCIKTTMNKINNSYLQQFNKTDFSLGNIYLTYESIRFFPHVYLTIFAILITLVMVIFKIIK